MLEAYTIKDNKSNSFDHPFFTNHRNEATRQFTRASRDTRTNINQFPNDFDLYFIGTFDEETCKFNAMETPQFVMSAASAISLPVEGNKK